MKPLHPCKHECVLLYIHVTIQHPSSHIACRLTGNNTNALVLNASFNSGTFPSLFKVARVTPLLKKPSLDPTQVETYRRVSLLTLLSKTIERAASKQVTEFLSKNNLLDPNQSGFKSGHSTETALLSVTEALKTARAA